MLRYEQLIFPSLRNSVLLNANCLVRPSHFTIHIGAAECRRSLLLCSHFTHEFSRDWNAFAIIGGEIFVVEIISAVALDRDVTKNDSRKHRKTCCHKQKQNGQCEKERSNLFTLELNWVSGGWTATAQVIDFDCYVFGLMSGFAISLMANNCSNVLGTSSEQAESKIERITLIASIIITIRFCVRLNAECLMLVHSPPIIIVIIISSSAIRRRANCKMMKFVASSREQKYKEKKRMSSETSM